MATSPRIRKGLLALMLMAASIPAQDSLLFAQGVGARQVKRRIVPEYPEVAKRMNLTGKVKVEVVIAPNGQVIRTRGMGGHPLFLRAAEAAVKDWKFTPSTEETVGVIEIEFAGTVVQ